jgi:hypothetical protein
MVGRGMELAQLHIVALYDPESGAVVSRHSVAVLKGGNEVSEGAAVEAARARAKAFYARLENDAAQMKKYAAAGQTLFPFDKLKVAVSHDPAHMGAGLRVDLRSGKLIAIEEDREETNRKPSTRS